MKLETREIPGGEPALVFLHAGSGRVNVVYRRDDGAIGWVDPPLAQA